MDDGSFKHRRLVFSTQSFTYEENQLLAELLSKTNGIHVRVKEVHYEGYDKTYYTLEITHKLNLSKLVKYIKKSDRRIVSVIKKYYGWKLSSERKSDFLEVLPEERKIEFKILPENDINVE